MDPQQARSPQGLYGPLEDEIVHQIRRTRRHPRPTQFDYVQLRYLLRNLAAVLGQLNGPLEVLDVFCGTRPYDDLLPAGSRSIGLDINNKYGVADVVTSTFLPFGNSSFDMVLCTEAFHYLHDPVRAVSEIARVLRPGGHAVISVPLVWEYDRTGFERRFTGPELTALFTGWKQVKILENGGFAATWAVVTGRMLRGVEQQTEKRLGGLPAVRIAFSLGYLAINAVAMLLDRNERRYRDRPFILPPNLLLTAQRPSG